MRAYAASKLCNVLTARAFAASPIAQERSLRVIAFNPGFTRGTQLTRNHGVLFNLFVAAMGAVQGLRRPMNTVEEGGGLLADLALGRIAPIWRACRQRTRRCRPGDRSRQRMPQVRISQRRSSNSAGFFSKAAHI
jgi:NAD(P)-dependent dehydrogenase (short-subunit alcohol dehydrogenase family)